MQLTNLQFQSLAQDDHGVAAVNFHANRTFRFRAGQHALWQIPGGGIHPFSLASAPEEDRVTLGTNLSTHSPLKRAVSNLTVESQVRILGPIGNFTPGSSAPSVVMLAQGIGVTPFRSILRHLALVGQATRTTLLQVGAGDPFRQDTEPLATTSSYFLTREQYVRELILTISQQPDTSYLVSGSPTFVSSTTNALRTHGISRRQIRRDAFWGYSGRGHAALRTQLA